MCELSSREFRQKLLLFPDEQRHLAVLACSMVGAENARRLEEAPPGVVAQGGDFVEQMLGLTEAAQDKDFPAVLERCLIEALADELRFSCANCVSFIACLNLDASELGALFRQRVEGDRSDELRQRTDLLVNQALECTPHLADGDAHLRCPRFRHTCSPSTIGAVFNRYADIAAQLAETYGISYRNFQTELIRTNMEFSEQHSRSASAG